MAIKLITFDFWNTIFDSGNGTSRNAYRIKNIKEQSQRLGFDLTDDSFQQAMSASWAYFNDNWLNKQRTPSTEETVRFYWDYLNIPYDDQALITLENVFAECILIYPPSLLHGVKEIINSLKKSYKLGIVSDTGFSPGSVLRQLLRKEELYDLFDAFSFSDETGVSKPHSKAFLSILEQLNILPGEAVHIGDIEETDIKGAKAIGMKAIRFSGDDTSFLNSNNRPPTIADAEINSWVEFFPAFGKLQ